MGSEDHDAILTAATELFARFGFKKTSIEDVARRAHIGKGTVYLHFESKEALFAAAIDRIWTTGHADLVSAVQRARSPEERFRAFVEGRQIQLQRVARDLQISEVAVLELVELARPHLRELRVRETALLERIIKEGNEDGAFAVRSPRLVAEGLTACLHGLDRQLLEPGATELQGALVHLNEILGRGLLSARRPGRTSS